MSGNTKIRITLKVIACFDEKTFANKVEFSIPMPPNTAICKTKPESGRAKYDATKQAIIWKVRKFPGSAEYILSAEADLMKSTTNKQWNRPPISAQFQINGFAASGLHVRFLKVYEKSGYKSMKWVRYLSKAASYKIRT